LNKGDQVWLVTTKEWNYYSQEVLDREELHYRLGKKLIYRHPSSLSTIQLKHFIETFYHDYKPRNPVSKFLSPIKVDSTSSPKNSPMFGAPQSEFKSHQIQTDEDQLRIFHNLSPERQQSYNTDVIHEGSAAKAFMEKSAVIEAKSVVSTTKQRLLARTNSHRKDYLQGFQPTQTDDEDDESSPRMALQFDHTQSSPVRLPPRQSSSISSSKLSRANKSVSPKLHKNGSFTSSTNTTDKISTTSSKIDELIKGRGGVGVKNYFEYRQLQTANLTGTSESPRTAPRSRREMLHTELFEVPQSEYDNAPHSTHSMEEFTVPLVEIDLFNATFSPATNHIALDDSFHDSDSVGAASVTSNGSLGPTKRARRSRRRQKRGMMAESAVASEVTGGEMIVESVDLEQLLQLQKEASLHPVVLPDDRVIGQSAVSPPVADTVPANLVTLDLGVSMTPEKEQTSVITAEIVDLSSKSDVDELAAVSVEEEEERAPGLSCQILFFVFVFLLYFHSSFNPQISIQWISSPCPRCWGTCAPCGLC
jgi:hypothetical protein